MLVMRRARTEAIDVVHKVLSAVQEAALAVHHAPDSAINRRKKKKWRALFACRVAKPSVRPIQLPCLAPTLPPKVLQVAIEVGPLPDDVGAGTSTLWRAGFAVCRQSARLRQNLVLCFPCGAQGHAGDRAS